MELDDDVNDVELLRRLEAELGPSQARMVPSLDPAQIEVTHIVRIRPEEIVSIIPVPLRPDLIRRPGDQD